MNRLQELVIQKINLEKQVEYLKLENELKVEQARVSERKNRMDLEKELVGLKVRNEELKNQLEKAPYKQLTDLLKALAVKLPTVDIKSLSVTTKGK